MAWLVTPSVITLAAVAGWSVIRFLVVDAILSRAMGQAICISISTLWIGSFALRNMGARQVGGQRFSAGEYFRVAALALAVWMALCILYPTVNCLCLSHEAIVGVITINMSCGSSAIIAIAAMARVVISGHLKHKLAAGALLLVAAGLLAVNYADLVWWFAKIAADF